jgi:hypothetical protein
MSFAGTFVRRTSFARTSFCQDLDREDLVCQDLDREDLVCQDEHRGRASVRTRPR